MRALALLLVCGGFNLGAGPFGLDERPVVGPFLDGALPVAEANVTGWQAEIAFASLTFDDPISITPEPGTDRIYICERQGKIWHFQNSPSTTNKTLFLDLTAVTQGYNDCGVLGFAFHPQYGVPGSTNRNYVYVYYSYSPSPASPANSDLDSYNRLSRFTVPDGSLVADPASELVLINQFDRHLWHNGGGMFFGPDGFLYLSNGDEGGIDDSFNQTQKINSGLFSGVLRIDVDKDPTRSHPIRRQPLSGSNPPGGWPPTYTTNYYIPNDNPWLATNGSLLEEFYAVGLRSPHRMTYDAVSGRIWLGDVGQGAWEEVDIIEQGGNYQWAYQEGTHTGPKSKPSASQLIGTDQPPVYDYAHTDGNNCVIGGYVYRGSQFPSLYGKYLFGDNGSGRVWAMDYDGINPTVVTQLFTLPALGIGLTSFGLDHDNEILMSIGGSNAKIYKLTATGIQAPPPPALLSETGAFTNLAALAPNPALIPFDVANPLWSDNAAKFRWMAVPNDGAPYGPDETIAFTTNGNWTFPVGTVLIKHFSLPVNDTNPAVLKRLETRFLVHATNDTWYGLTYKWRDDNSDADLLPGSLNETNFITTTTGIRTQVWYYPSRADCRSCHTANSGQVLGPRTSLFNTDVFYPDTGVTDNQIRALNHIGMFDVTLNEAGIPTFPKTASLSDTNATPELRVRSYLQSNCAHCHQPGGVQGLFDARFSTPLESQGLVNGEVGNALGIVGAKVIAPQSTAQSILHVRDSALGGIQMPPLARNVVDTNYLNILAEWINSLPLPPAPPPEALGTIGNTNTGPSSDNIWDNGAYINAARFQASSNMTVAIIRANVAGVSGSYKCAIYAGSSSLPGSLLGSTVALTNPATGWQTFPLIAPLNLTNGDYYWLAIWSDSSSARVHYSGTGGTLRWGQFNYGEWPDPLATSGGGDLNYSIYATGGSAPQFVGAPSNLVIPELTLLIVTNTATDADAPAQTLIYSLVNAPEGAAISDSGVITWTPSEEQGPSTNSFTTVVTDGVVNITNSFQVIVTEVNAAPIAHADEFSRWMSQGFSAPTSALLANDTDPDGDTVIFDSLFSPSATGTTVTLSNATVYYWPLFGNTNADSFNYRVTDGFGAYSTGLVSISVMPDPPVTELLGLDIGGGNYSLSFTGVPGFTYTVQYTDVLEPANWQNVGVVTANEVGDVQIMDGSPGSGPSRFYRAVRGIAP